MDTTTLSEQFTMLLERGAQELFEDNRHRMGCADLLATRHRIAEDDLRRFFLGLQRGALTLVRGARFNTLDRPATGGRWGLLSRESGVAGITRSTCRRSQRMSKLIHDLGYPSRRVFFELPHVRIKLDLAILGDDGAVRVLGEAKRAVFMLDELLKEIQDRYSAEDPGEEGRNEARQLAWGLWRTRAPYFWSIGPAGRRAYHVRYEP